MMIRTESKLQGWRALAIADDQTEHLIYLGRSSTQVRTGYIAAFLELLDKGEQAAIQRIALQRWDGAADVGRWLPHTTLPIPSAAKTGARALASTA